MIPANPAAAVAALIPLQMLRPGEPAEIAQLIGRPEQVHRLQELGVRAGLPVEMLQSGSPCIVRLAEQRLCFRESDTIGILVRLGSSF
jgi:ferrous iron transport protein A